MRSTITARGQTMIPAAIRARFSLGPSQLQWIVEADGSIRVVPVDSSPVKAFAAWTDVVAPVNACLLIALLSGRSNRHLATDFLLAASVDLTQQAGLLCIAATVATALEQ